jgi:hypothetical protein
MNRWIPGTWLVASAGFAMLAGCHMQPTYGPGYYNSGPMYGPSYSQPQYMTPGPVYTPQNMGAPTLNSPTPINPGSPTPNAPTWRPDPNNGLDSSAPPFKPNNDRVPDPLDPGFGDPPGAALVPRASPIATVGGGDAPMFPGNDPDPFESPAVVNPGAEPVLKPAGGSSPYAFDETSYTFVKGIVDYDALSKTWSIIYDLQPRDRFGGSFIFAPHPQLQNLKPGDLVMAKGRVDPGRTDTRGKPLYEITTITVVQSTGGVR